MIRASVELHHYFLTRHSIVPKAPPTASAVKFYYHEHRSVLLNHSRSLANASTRSRYNLSTGHNIGGLKLAVPSSGTAASPMGSNQIAAAGFANFAVLYQINPDLSIAKSDYRNHAACW
jgi:hypothetical protein